MNLKSQNMILKSQNTILKSQNMILKFLNTILKSQTVLLKFQNTILKSQNQISETNSIVHLNLTFYIEKDSINTQNQTKKTITIQFWTLKFWTLFNF